MDAVPRRRDVTTVTKCYAFSISRCATSFRQTALIGCIQYAYSDPGSRLISLYRVKRNTRFWSRVSVRLCSPPAGRLCSPRGIRFCRGRGSVLLTRLLEARIFTRPRTLSTENAPARRYRASISRREVKVFGLEIFLYEWALTAKGLSDHEISITKIIYFSK